MVLSRVCADGTERPVAFASWTLLPNEQKKRCQCTKIHLRPRVHTYDRSPTICGPIKGVLLLVTARLQRLALLFAYQYNIEFLDWHMLMQMGCPSCRLSKKLLQETPSPFCLAVECPTCYSKTAGSCHLYTRSWAEY